MSLDCVWRFSKRWKKGAIGTVVFPKWGKYEKPTHMYGLLRNPQVSDLREDRGLRLPQLYSTADTLLFIQSNRLSITLQQTQCSLFSQTD